MKPEISLTGVSLRRMLGVSISLLCATAIVVSVSLIVLTTLIHDSSKSLESALHGLSLAEKAQIELLLVDRTPEVTEREAMIDQLRHNLVRLRGYTTGAREAASLPRAASSVEEYLVAVRGSGSDPAVRARSLGAAYSALGDLVEINADQARTTQDQAATWNRLADRIGFGAVAFVLGATAFLIWYVGTEAVRPVLRLADVIERFGGGDLGARARERGPAELRQIAARFNAMADALADQRDARLAFLSGVAHDLRSPVHALGMLIELLPSEGASSPDQRREILDRARRQTRRLERMTADFLDRAQIESGRFELKLETVNAAELVAHGTEPFAGTSPVHYVELSIPHSVLLARCDPLRVDQVLTNLVSNAIKYSPGGGRVRAWRPRAPASSFPSPTRASE